MSPKQPWSGIVVQQQMQWLLECVYLRRPLTRPQGRYTTDASYLGGGTPNMKLLYCLGWYAWAVLSKSSDLAAHRQRMVNIITRDRTCHGQGEPTTSSHGQLWLAGMAGALYVAMILDASGSSSAGPTIEWLRFENHVHTVTRDTVTTTEPDANGMYCPGARGFTRGNHPGSVPLGNNPTRGKMWSAITRGKVKGKPNQYDIGAWFMSKVGQGTRDLITSPPQEFPPLYGGPFHARRFDDRNWYAWYENMPDDVKNPPTRSAGCIDGALWVSAAVETEKIAELDKLPPVMILDAPQGYPAGASNNSGDDDEPEEA